MGTARIRKAKGQYPTFLSAASLLLPKVPDHAKEEVRRFLKPCLSSVVCQRQPDGGGDCWNIAQQLMMAANSPRVCYVEGVYDDVRGYYDEDFPPPPHGWNTVDGYIVDLPLEHRWQLEPNLNRDWIHSPFKEYTLTEVEKYFDEVDDFDGLAITPLICDWGLAEEYGYTFTDDDIAACTKACKDNEELSWEQVVFQPAAARLIEAIKSAQAVVA
jgi:hypothetical protein